ncbi:MAG: diguanylate cyclase [Nitrospirae bacterium]|nr:MAG: diguanylate cyclase [Nitrospirota bacterium]
MHILIIDDERDSLLLLKKILRDAGYKDVFVAGSAEEAFCILGIKDECVPAAKIDMILTDVYMPGMDGIEAVRRIKSHKSLEDVPVIMITASNDSDKLQASFALGAVDYIMKPINKFELISRIRSVIRLKHETDKRKEREHELMEVSRRLEDANRILMRISSEDGLTGLQNRRFFDEHFEIEWKRAFRESSKLSLIMIDVDYFKAYNDRYGHLAGDDCLKMVTAALKALIKRPADFIARYGGEEFVVVLPATDEVGALKVAEEMRQTVESAGIAHENSTTAPCVTISLGVACADPVINNVPEALIADADRALYRAKAGGRNRVEVA